MIEVSSKDNQWIKTATKLKQKKGRQKSQSFLLEGERYIQYAYDNAFEIDAIMFSREKWDQLDQSQQVTYEAMGICIVLEDSLLELVSETVNSQGAIAIVKMKSLSHDPLERKESLLIYLDRLQDPGNLGTIIRTADAVGIKTIFMNKGCVDPYNAKVIRSTAGSILNVQLIHVEEDEKALQAIKSKGYHIVATDLNATHSYLDKTAYGHQNCLIIGNEANGISESVKRLSDVRVIIPIDGYAESLNASVAAAIMMYKLKEIQDLLS